MVKNIPESSQGADPPQLLQRRKSLPQPLEQLGFPVAPSEPRDKGGNSFLFFHGFFFNLILFFFFNPSTFTEGDESRGSPLACALFGVF